MHHRDKIIQQIDAAARLGTESAREWVEQCSNDHDRYQLRESMREGNLPSEEDWLALGDELERPPTAPEPTMTKPLTARHDADLDLGEISRLARVCGASCSFPFLRDVLLWGSVGAVRKTLAGMGLGFDTDRRGKVQSINDASGRCWGTITYNDATGRASAMLDYLLAAG